MFHVIDSMQGLQFILTNGDVKKHLKKHDGGDEKADRGSLEHKKEDRVLKLAVAVEQSHAHGKDRQQRQPKPASRGVASKCFYPSS